MIDDCHAVPPKHERRLQAVLALFRGEPVATVSPQYRIGLSDLYKFRAHAPAAMCEALRDHPRGPKRPHNRLDPHREERVVAFCQRHPTLSSYQVRQRLGPDTRGPRTIQRVRERHPMARVPKGPVRKNRSFTEISKVSPSRYTVWQRSRRPSHQRHVRHHWPSGVMCHVPTSCSVPTSGPPVTVAYSTPSAAIKDVHGAGVG